MELSVATVFTFALVMLPHGNSLYCHQGTKLLQAGQNTVPMESSSCPDDGKTYSCTEIETVIEGDGEEKTIVVGKCFPTVTCSTDVCSLVEKDIRMQYGYELTIESCTFKCCQEDHCNFANQAPPAGGAKPKLYCHQGVAEKQPGSSSITMKSLPCPDDDLTYSCTETDIQAEKNGQKVTLVVGSCFPSEECSQDICPMVLENIKSLGYQGQLTSGSCTFKCCDVDRCNFADNSFSPSTTTSTVQQSPTSENEENHDQRLMCHQGAQIKYPGKSHQAMKSLPCPDDGQTYNCSMTDVIVDENGQDVTIVVGKCFPSVVCKTNICPLVLKDLKNYGYRQEFTTKSCSSSCCEGNHCNSSNNFKYNQLLVIWLAVVSVTSHICFQ